MLEGPEAPALIDLVLGEEDESEVAPSEAGSSRGLQPGVGRREIADRSIASARAFCG